MLNFICLGPNVYVAALHTVEAVRAQLARPAHPPNTPWMWGEDAIFSFLHTTMACRATCRHWRRRALLPPFVVPALVRGTMARIREGAASCWCWPDVASAFALAGRALHGNPFGELCARFKDGPGAAERGPAPSAQFQFPLTWEDAVAARGDFAASAWLRGTCTMLPPETVPGLLYLAARAPLEARVPDLTCRAWLALWVSDPAAAQGGPSARLDAAVAAAACHGNVPLTRLLTACPRVVPGCNNCIAVRNCGTALAFAETTVPTLVRDLLQGPDCPAAVVPAVHRVYSTFSPSLEVGLFLESAWPTWGFRALADALVPAAALVPACAAVVRACVRVAHLRECLLQLGAAGGPRAYMLSPHNTPDDAYDDTDAPGAEADPPINHVAHARLARLMEGVVPLHASEQAGQGFPTPARDVASDSENEDADGDDAAEDDDNDDDDAYYRPMPHWGLFPGSSWLGGAPFGSALGPTLVRNEASGCPQAYPPFARPRWRAVTFSPAALPVLPCPVAENPCGVFEWATARAGAEAVAEPAASAVPETAAETAVANVFVARQVLDALYAHVRSGVRAITFRAAQHARHVTGRLFHCILQWNAWWQLLGSAPTALQHVTALRRPVPWRGNLLFTVPVYMGRTLQVVTTLPPTPYTSAMEWDALPHDTQAALVLHCPFLQGVLREEAEELAAVLWDPIIATARRGQLRTGCLSARPGRRLFLPGQGLPRARVGAYMGSLFAVRALATAEFASLSTFVVANAVSVLGTNVHLFWALWGLGFRDSPMASQTVAQAAARVAPCMPWDLVRVQPHCDGGPPDGVAHEVRHVIRHLCKRKNATGRDQPTLAVQAASLLTCFPDAVDVMDDSLLRRVFCAQGRVPLWQMLTVPPEAAAGCYKTVPTTRATTIAGAGCS